jgi:predicted GNAT superfamily acetyltransferase
LASAEIEAAAMLALNNAHVPHVTAIDAGELQSLIDQAFHVGVRGEGRDAFAIALDQDADYGSPNFLWFKERLPRFVYVDRIVVSSDARGKGLGRKLYEELFKIGIAAGHSVVACEVNVDPPNPISDRFHAALGFEEVGRAPDPRWSKLVRYLVRKI